MPCLGPVPLDRGLHDVLGAGLLDGELELLVEVPVELVVDVEVVAEAVARVEHVGRDEGARRVAPGLEPPGRRRDPGREAEARVLPDPVLVRKQSGQDVRVRRKGDHVVRVRLTEHPAFGREPVEVRRRPPRIAAEADGIGPERVDRDHDDVAGHARSGRAAAPRGPPGGTTRATGRGSRRSRPPKSAASRPPQNERARPEFPDGPRNGASPRS